MCPLVASFIAIVTFSIFYYNVLLYELQRWSLISIPRKKTTRESIGWFILWQYRVRVGKLNWLIAGVMWINGIIVIVLAIWQCAGSTMSFNCDYSWTFLEERAKPREWKGNLCTKSNSLPTTSGLNYTYSVFCPCSFPLINYRLCFRR